MPELYFTDILWPDFDERQVDLCVKEFYSRKAPIRRNLTEIFRRFQARMKRFNIFREI